MSQGKYSFGCWSRGAITLLVVVWLAIAVAQWIADQEIVRKKLGEGESKGTVQETNIPEAKRRPWRGDISALQRQLDEANSSIVAGEDQQTTLVVASPITDGEKNNENEIAVAEDNDESIKYCLQFSSYKRDDLATQLLTRLSVKNVTAHIETGTDTDGTTVYRVFSDKEYDNKLDAENMKSELLKVGIDSFVVSR